MERHLINGRDSIKLLRTGLYALHSLQRHQKVENTILLDDRISRLEQNRIIVRTELLYQIRPQ